MSSEAEQHLSLSTPKAHDSAKISDKLVSGSDDKPSESIIEAKEAEIEIDRTNTVELQKKHEESMLNKSLKTIVTDENERFYGDPDHDCFMIISLISAELPENSPETMAKLSKKGWDPFLKACFTMGDSVEPIKLHTQVLWKSNERIPTWNQYKKYKMPSIKSQEHVYPSIVTFQLWDKYFFETDQKEDELIGEYTLKCKDEHLFDVSKKFSETVEITGGTMNNVKITVGLSFECVNEINLKKLQFRERQKCLVNAIGPRTLKWLDNNIDLFLDLQQKESQGIRINDESFSLLSAPPVGFRQIFYKEYENFISRFGNDFEDNGKCRLTLHLDKETRVLYALNRSENDNLHCGGNNVTNIVHLVWRFVYLKDYILKGQDAEFNIYRSYYFDASPSKLYLSLIGIILQITLCIALTVNVVRNWDPDLLRLGSKGGRENTQDFLIFLIAGVVFSFLSLTTSKTIGLYLDFYSHLYLGFEAPWYFVICDYISNVIITIYITIIGFFYLTQSPDYGELVLNSFALQFVYEIDDIINIFENDENEVIKTELQAFVRSRYQVPRKYNVRIWKFWPILLSPVWIFQSLWWAIKGFGIMFIFARHKKRKNEFMKGDYKK
mmetsp:Transcript_96578/g.118340  ORF Transcript_96578/g.118340 Transcript_96578/m.118340 type:complete len:610 (-) Transcript_96578:57-1886(-)